MDGSRILNESRILNGSNNQNETHSSDESDEVLLLNKMLIVKGETFECCRKLLRKLGKSMAIVC
jgi:hypothetical protein